VDKMIVMGSKMDGAALQEAARAHVKAIESMDAKGVLKQGDLEAILAGLGKAISSVPEATVMDVYNEMSNLVGESNGQIPKFVYAKQNPADAMAAYNALMDFKDTVRKAQSKPQGDYDKGLDMEKVIQTVGFLAVSSIAVLPFMH